MNIARFKWPIIAVPFILVTGFIYSTGGSLLLFAQSLVLQLGVYLPLSITLNMEAGYTGIPNFGKMLYFGGGAAVGGALATFLWSALVGGVNFGAHCIPFLCVPAGFETNNEIVLSVTVNPFLASHPLYSIATLLAVIAAGAGVGAALGYLSSFPAINLREDYLGMLLLASAQLFVVFDEWYEPLNFGALGTFGIPNLYGWIPGNLRYWAIGGILMAFSLLVYYHAERTARSPLGRKLRAIRDSEVASEALGKNTVSDRRKTLMYASAVSGITGAFYVLTLGYVGFSLFNRVLFSLYPWVIIVMGGTGNNLGALFATFTFTYILSAVDQLKGSFASPSIPTFSLVTAAPELALVFAGGYVLLGRRGIERYLRKKGREVGARVLGMAGAALVILGAVAFSAATWTGELPLGSFIADTNYLEYIAFGVILIVILIVRPEGIIPEKPSATFRAGKLRNLVEKFKSESGSSDKG